MAEMAPRLAHNLSLASAYIAGSGVTSRYPKVTEQIETVKILGNLKPYGYNGSIVDFGGRTLLAYRYHEVEYSTKIAMAELDADFRVIGEQVLPIPGISAEDPRWFVHAGELWLSWVESNWPKEKWCVIKHQKHGAYDSAFRLNVDQNNGKGMSKNFIFFDQAGTLFCIYRCCPTQQTMVVRGESVVETHETTGPRWPYGDIRGGTPPVEYDGHYLRFFHSSLDNDFGRYRRRYFFGAYLMENQPPFAVKWVSKKPILYGSEADDLIPAEKESRKKLKVNMHQNTCLPYGVIVRDGAWIVSLGVNDSAVVLAKITSKDLGI